MCEIIDVLTPCFALKGKIVDVGKQINEGLTFNLELIVESLDRVNLENQKPTDEEWKAFAEIFSRAVEIKKLKYFQYPISKQGVEWIKTVSIAQSSQGKNEQKIENPFQYLEKIIANEEFGFSCSAKDEFFSRFFDECQNKIRGSVSHVLKTASDCCFEDKKTYGVSRRQSGNRWATQHLVKPREMEEFSKFKRLIERSLVSSGIVDENCKSLQTSIFGLYIVNHASGFCHEINKLFFGNTVDEKPGESTLPSTSSFFYPFHIYK